MSCCWPGSWIHVTRTSVCGQCGPVSSPSPPSLCVGQPTMRLFLWITVSVACHLSSLVKCLCTYVSALFVVRSVGWSGCSFLYVVGPWDVWCKYHNVYLSELSAHTLCLMEYQCVFRCLFMSCLIENQCVFLLYVSIHELIDGVPMSFWHVCFPISCLVEYQCVSLFGCSVHILFGWTPVFLSVRAVSLWAVW